MVKTVDTHYSPPHLSGYVQTAFTLGALGVGIATYLRGDHWPYLNRLRDWQQIGVTTAPFLIGRFLTGRYLRPVRELPDDVIKLDKDPGAKERRPVADLVRWALRPLGKHAIYQKTTPGCQSEGEAYQGEREGIIDKLGGEKVKIEAYQEPGRPYTLLLDGLRFEPGAETDIEFEKVGKKGSHKVPMRQLPAKNEVVLVFPAFGGNMRDYLWLVAFLVASGRSVQIVDWRGFGESEGDPYSKGLELDVQATVDAAKSWKPGAKITCYGHCAGADSALYAAKYAGEDVQACVLDRSTLDWDTVVYQGMWYVGWPLAKLANWLYPYDCKKRADDLGKDVPIHIFRALGDDFLHTPEKKEDDLHVKPLYMKGDHVHVHDIGKTGHFSNWWVQGEFGDARQELLKALDRE